jgi:hypothetical protein
MVSKEFSDACGCFLEMPEGLRVRSNTRSRVVQAPTKTLSKMSDENDRNALRPTQYVGRCDRHP